MFGDPLSSLALHPICTMSLYNAQTSSQDGMSSETLALVEAVLDYIRANLENIKKVWGVDSAQYKSAATIMNSYLDENLKKQGIEKDDIADLLKDLKLDDGKQQSGDVQMKT